MNINDFNWNVFKGLNDYNIITLTSINKSNDETDDLIFETILKGAEAKLNESILSYI